MSGREPTGASFEPERLRPARRRLDPAVLAAGIVVVAIVVAVLKPWAAPMDQAATPLGTSGAGASVAVVTSPTPSPEPEPSDQVTLGAAGAAAVEPERRRPPITWADAAPVLRGHDAWGVRAVVRDPEPDARSDPATDPPGSGLVERWAAPDTPSPGDDVAVLPTGGRQVLAVGVTFPPDQMPLDARIWRARGDDRGWEWLDARPLDPTPSLGAMLFAPPRTVDGYLPAWPAGRYRIDLLVGGSVRSIHADLPPGVAARPPVIDALRSGTEPLVSAFASVTSGIDGGLFATVDGRGVPIAGAGIAVSDPGAAWIQGVPSVFEPRATGLGVMFPVGASSPNATLRRLVPDGNFEEPRRAPGIRFDDAGRWPYMLFRAPGGGAWPAGVYGVEAGWTDAAGTHRASYAVELRPGRQATPPPALAAARALANRAGSDGVLGIPRWPVDGLRRAFVEGVDLTCGARGSMLPTGEQPALLAIGHPVGVDVSTARLELLLDGGRTRSMPVLIARDVVPGLSLLAPASGQAFPTGVHRLDVGDGADARTTRVCIGVAGD
jgi:hypothetical protein